MSSQKERGAEGVSYGTSLLCTESKLPSPLDRLGICSRGVRTLCQPGSPRKGAVCRPGFCTPRSVPKGLHGCLSISRQTGHLGYSVYLHGKRCRRESPRRPERPPRLPFKRNNDRDLMETAARRACQGDKWVLTMRLVVTLWLPRMHEGCGISSP